MMNKLAHNLQVIGRCALLIVFVLAVLGWNGVPVQAQSNAQLGTASTIPTPSAPKGTIFVRTPTFVFTRVTGATQYRISVFKGTSTTALYTATFYATSCGSSSTTCSYTPTTVLSAGAYYWKVRAYVSNLWGNYSNSLSFTYVPLGPAFDSEFTTSASGWKAVTGTWNFASGYYQSAGLGGLNSSAVHSGNFSTQTYIVKMKRTGCATCANYVYLNGTPEPHTSNSTYWWYSGYRFQYTNNGSISIYRFDKGSPIYVLDWSYSPAVTNSWNTMAITYNPSKGFYTWKINGVLVSSGFLTNYKYGQVGLGLYADTISSKGILYVDYAKLSMTAPASTAEVMGSGIFVDDSVLSAGVNGDPDQAK